MQISHMRGNMTPAVITEKKIVAMSMIIAPRTVVYSIPKGPKNNVKKNAAATLFLFTTTTAGTWAVVC